MVSEMLGGEVFVVLCEVCPRCYAVYRDVGAYESARRAEPGHLRNLGEMEAAVCPDQLPGMVNAVSPYCRGEGGTENTVENPGYVSAVDCKRIRYVRHPERRVKPWLFMCEPMVDFFSIFVNADSEGMSVFSV